MSELYSRTDKKTSLFGLQVHGPVFFTSASLILLSIVLTILYRDSASELFSVIQTQVSTKTGWFFILSVNIFLVLSCIWPLVSLSGYGLVEMKQNRNFLP